MSFFLGGSKTLFSLSGGRKEVPPGSFEDLGKPPHPAFPLRGVFLVSGVFFLCVAPGLRGVGDVTMGGCLLNQLA